MIARFLIDEQLPPALARWLSAQGYPSDHANDLGLRAAPDSRIVARALRTGAIVWSKDGDFKDFALRTPRVQVVWLRFGNIATPLLKARLAPLLPTVSSQLLRGQNPVEIP